MEQLAGMMSHFNIPDDDDSRRGRRTELKTYIVEANSLLPAVFQFDKISGHIENTGIDDVNIIHLTSRDSASSFYLDKSDKRFWLLHTHGLAEDVDRLVEYLTSVNAYQLDSTWFSTGMLKRVSQVTGNRFDGAGIDYETIFTDDETEVPMEELKISVFGFRAIEALRNMSSDDYVKNYFAFKKVRVRRGDLDGYAKDDFNFNGRFSVKSGTSIDDHIALVDIAKNLYKDEMKTIEDQSIGIRNRGKLASIDGKPFEFAMEKPIVDWDKFMNVLLSSAYPFRLWGIKKRVNEIYHQVLAVDLHTGHSVDLEISKDIIRIYLPKGSCGNVVLRLFVNLQHYWDSRIKCEELPYDGGSI